MINAPSKSLSTQEVSEVIVVLKNSFFNLIGNNHTILLMHYLTSLTMIFII